MDSDKGLRDFRKEVRQAWTNGCLCELCLAVECDEQDYRAGIPLAEYLDLIHAAGVQEHGPSGFWPTVENQQLMRASNAVRRKVGWPEYVTIRVVVRPGSESGHSPPPISRPN